MDETATQKAKNKKRITFVISVMVGLCLLCVLCFISLMIIGDSPQGKAASTKVSITMTAAAKETFVYAQTQTAAPTATPSQTPTATPTATLKPSATPTKTLTPENTATPVIDENVKAIMDGTGLTRQDAEKAFEIFKSIGVKQVKKLTFITQIENMKGYDASLGYTKNFSVTFIENEVFGISLDSIVFYDRDAGGVLDKIANYTLNAEEKNTFIYLVQEHVLQFLKSPSSAEFPGVMFNLDQWRVVREKDIVWVQSWVDAENAFGAKLRNKFTAQYSYSSQKLLYLEIEGKVVFGSIQKP